MSSRKCFGIVGVLLFAALLLTGYPLKVSAKDFPVISPMEAEENGKIDTATDSAISLEKDGLGRPALAVENQKRRIKLFWEPVSLAEEYVIYRADRKDGSYKRYGITEKNFWVDKEVRLGRKYYYKVYARAEGACGRVYSKRSAIKSGETRVPGTVIWTAGCYRDRYGLNMYWKEADGADGYVVQYSIDGKKWSKLAFVQGKNCSYVNAKLKEKGKFYRIRAFREVEGVKYYGGGSPVIEGRNLFCSAYEDYSLKDKLLVLRKLFPEGGYWHHRDVNIAGFKKEEAALVISNHSCEHNSKGYGGCNVYNGNTRLAMPTVYRDNRQCLGFASMVSDFLLGQKTKIRKVTKFDDLQIGDHIRFTGLEHSVVVIAKGKDYIKVVECNRDYRTCKIEWDRKITKKEMSRWKWYGMSKNT